MKNKLNNKKIAIVIAILVILIIGIGIYFGINNTGAESKDNINNPDIKPVNNIITLDDGQSTDKLPLVSEDGVDLVMTQENFDEIVEKMNSYDEVYITKKLFEYVSSASNPNTDPAYHLIEDYETKITSSEGIVHTLDVIKLEEAKTEYNCDVDGLNLDDYKVDTKEVLKIDTDKKYENNIDVLMAVADAYNVDVSNYVGSRLDKDFYDDVYEEYKQKVYACPLKNNELDLSIVGLSEDDYDEIVSTQIYFHISTSSKDNKEVLNEPLVIWVDYIKDGNYHMRSLYIDFMGMIYY